MGNFLSPNNANNLTEEQKLGYNPVAATGTRGAEISKAQKVMFVILSVLTLGIYWLHHMVFKTVNVLLKQQNQINSAASSIDVQLSKRFGTLSKLVDAGRSYFAHEKDIMTNVAKFRSMAGQLSSGNLSSSEAGQLRNELEAGMNGLLSRLLAVHENYPELKASSITRDLMEQASYLESEIAASRRLYNTHANEFNIQLSTFPTNYVAWKKKYTTVPLFLAASKERQDVSMSLN
ncbi:LemA family protein [Mycoplasmopsis columbinasalis]|uniref:LemA family n=1 Tax=Mycoplasmopsis columbinasalis TaxID=114880 RepID=A0A449BAU8_9BACT|nr:LemA family protein [Mycoplasmopsis columbinasalis]VEU78298.1 LemA family [Mycoplasmopsis columbinasalis]